MKKSLWITFAVMLYMSPALATTYNVSKSGSPDNSCTTATAGGASARLTLSGPNGGCACLSAGDTLLVDDGVYNEQISSHDDEEHPTPCVPPSGTSASNRTIIKSKNFRGATLNKPGSSIPYNHVVFNNSNEYVSVEDFIIDARGHGVGVWIGPGLTFGGHKIKGNYITNAGGNGMYVASHDTEPNIGRGFEIVDNEIVNIAGEHGTTPPGTHAIYNTGRETLIRGNYIHGTCEFYGIHSTSELGGIFSVTIENNRVVGCGQAGIVNQASTSIIRNNLLEGNGIGIRVQGASSQKVYNNTIFNWKNSTVNGDDSFGIYDTTGGTLIRNNLILQQRDVSSVRRYIFYLNAPTLENNLCDAVNAQNCQITVASYTTVVVDGFGGNLQLKSGSEAIDAGVTLTTDVPQDRLGVSRPQNSVYDIGAYEFVTGGDITFPTVSITAPGEGATVGGSTVSVTANAADNIGVVGVQFQLDGENLAVEDLSSPYGITWDTTISPNGAHVLTAVARDAADNSTTSTAVNVIVNNVSTVPTVFRLVR